MRGEPPPGGEFENENNALLENEIGFVIERRQRCLAS